MDRPTSIVRVPLIPGIVTDGRALDVPVEASLENSSIASVAVYADPLRLRDMLTRTNDRFMRDESIDLLQSQRTRCGYSRS